MIIFLSCSASCGVCFCVTCLEWHLAWETILTSLWNTVQCCSENMALSVNFQIKDLRQNTKTIDALTLGPPIMIPLEKASRVSHNLAITVLCLPDFYNHAQWWASLNTYLHVSEAHLLGWFSKPRRNSHIFSVTGLIVIDLSITHGHDL